MHPNPKFRWEDWAELRALVADEGFGTLFAATPEGPRAAHVPAVWLDDDTLGIHLANGNALTRHLDARPVLFSVIGPHAYVSPDWYGLGPDEVPTWNYLAVELEGTAHAMDRTALIAQIDALSHANETRLAKPEWTRAKADPGKIDKMLGAITGFRIAVTAWRGTRKLGQNKPEAARLSAADALGDHPIASLMREA